MKTLKTTDELASVLNGNGNVLVKFGQPGCIPCKMASDALNNIEKEIQMDYYDTENIDIAISKGFTKLPVVILKANGVENTLTDNEILMDEDELKAWIKTHI